MKKKPENSEQSLANFLNDFKRKRLKKKLSVSEVFAKAHVSMRDWHAWNKVLAKGEKRRFPLSHHRTALRDALVDLPARPKLLRGRPPGPRREKVDDTH